MYNLLNTSVGGCTTCCTLQWVDVQPAVHFSGWMFNLLYTSVGGCTTCCTLIFSHCTQSNRAQSNLQIWSLGRESICFSAFRLDGAVQRCNHARKKWFGQNFTDQPDSLCSKTIESLNSKRVNNSEGEGRNHWV